MSSLTLEPIYLCIDLIGGRLDPIRTEILARSSCEAFFFEKGVSHEHFCFDHTIDSEGVIRGNGVQTARKIDPDFADFETAVAYVCGMLNITNADEIPPLDAQGAMF